MSIDMAVPETGSEDHAGADIVEESAFVDPRSLLADWANANDEWVRLLVSEAITTGRSVDTSTLETAYQLFRQEKSLDKRELPAVPKLSVEARQDESAPPLTLTRLSDVRGVNALTTGAVIEPHEGLTIIYGENGTGKTGYSRIFKALANSRTADTILGNIEAEASEAQSAELEFKLGDETHTLTWAGDQGVSPFTRMSIFDSPAVRTHVDDDLDYVYTPASLALFNDITTAIQAVAAQIDATIADLSSSGSDLLTRFQRGSTIYPLIEMLGASTDLTDLKSKARFGEAVEKELDSLTQEVAALRANTMGTQITALKSQQRVVAQALSATDALLVFDRAAYNGALTKRARLTTDYETFRRELFAAVDLPAEPDDTWNEFIDAGEIYRQHLVDLEAHDDDHCLYCRQPLSDPARGLLARYSTYLEDKISADIRANETVITRFKSQIAAIQSNDMTAFIMEHKGSDQADRPTFFDQVEAIEGVRNTVATSVADDQPVDINVADLVALPRVTIEAVLTTTGASITELEGRQQNRARVLGEKQTELLELKDAVELGKSWSLVEAQVKRAIGL